MPAVEQIDPEKALCDWLIGLVNNGELSSLVGWTVGTVLQPGETPKNAIRFRQVGGVEDTRITDRPRIDMRVWADGSYLTEATAKQVSRVVLARLRRDFRSIVITDPIPLPDPADPSRTYVMTTVELLTRGVQRS